jgi:hypothetical protein
VGFNVDSAVRSGISEKEHISRDFHPPRTPGSQRRDATSWLFPNCCRASITRLFPRHSWLPQALDNQTRPAAGSEVPAISGIISGEALSTGISRTEGPWVCALVGLSTPARSHRHSHKVDVLEFAHAVEPVF